MIIQKLKDFDVWVGKTVFHPPVIFLCQLLKCTQYRLHRDLWFMAVMFLFCVDVFVSKESPVWWKWILLVFFFLIAVRMDPNKKTTSNPIFRLFFWLMFVRDLILSAILIFYNQALPTLVLLVFNCTVMLAEYAITIDTIPPRKDKKKNKREVYHESYSG